MGAWGPAIFSDDTACDIRSDYRELLEDGVEDHDATERIIDSYAHLDEDEAHILSLALSASQAALGRLDEQVKARALDVIDHEVGLDLWAEEGPKPLASRKTALASLRATLVGAQKPRKPVRRPWSHVTDLSPGDVLAYTTAGERIVLFRVARLNESRAGGYPVLRQLSWDKAVVPEPQELVEAEALPEKRRHPRGQGTNHGIQAAYNVLRYRKRDPDWPGVGLDLIGHADPAPDDANYQSAIYTDWHGLRKDLTGRKP